MMVQTTQPPLQYKRAIVTFLLAYFAITVVATGFSLLVGALLGASPVTEPLQDPGYILSEKFLPLLNLIVWTPFSLLYFKKRTNRPGLRKEALALGAFWLAMALPVDFLGFVVIQSPLSLSAHDFYIGQFPWIYLIYLAVFMSPFCGTAFVKVKTLSGTPKTNEATT
jgi:hypothetical protein